MPPGRRRSQRIGQSILDDVFRFPAVPHDVAAHAGVEDEFRGFHVLDGAESVEHAIHGADVVAWPARCPIDGRGKDLATA